jgi:hypothetical protein
MYLIILVYKVLNSFAKGHYSVGLGEGYGKLFD